MRLLAVMAVAVGWSAALGAAAAPAPVAAKRLADAAFAPPAASASDPFKDLLEADLYDSGPGAARWTNASSAVVAGKARRGSIDTLRFSVTDQPEALKPAGGRATAVDPAYRLELSRAWPGALRYDSVDVSPHAGVGLSSAGGSAEAGAVVRMDLDQKAKDRLEAIGVSDGSSFGDTGRWYLFAAASGRAVGLNVLRDESGWNRAGWTTDPSSALIGDAQLGVGWRRGAVQTSFGYVHREVKGQHRIWGEETRADSLVAFSMSIKPGR